MKSINFIAAYENKKLLGPLRC